MHSEKYSKLIVRELTQSKLLSCIVQTGKRKRQGRLIQSFIICPLCVPTIVAGGLIKFIHHFTNSPAFAR